MGFYCRITCNGGTGDAKKLNITLIFLFFIIFFSSGTDVELTEAGSSGFWVGVIPAKLLLPGGKFSWCWAQQPFTGPLHSLGYRRGRDGTGKRGSRARAQRPARFNQEEGEEREGRVTQRQRRRRGDRKDKTTCDELVFV